MTVKDIVTKYLKDNGYDGLCGDACGCGLDNLFPCELNDGGYYSGCEPAYKQTNPYDGGRIYNGWVPSEWYSPEKDGRKK